MKVVIAYGFGVLLAFCTDALMCHQIRKSDWQCTASRIIKESLPREEECVQYSRKEP